MSVSQQKENSATIIAKIIEDLNSKVTDISNVKDAIKIFESLDDTFKDYDIKFKEDAISTLLKKSPVFDKIAEWLFDEYIETENDKKILKNNFLKMVIRQYQLIYSDVNENPNQIEENLLNDNELSEMITDLSCDDSLRMYLNEISQYPLLSSEQVKELSYKVANGDEEAAKKLVVSNLRLVVSIAKRYYDSSLPLLDLIQEGNIGLMKAAKMYSSERGFQFSTYATWWIFNKIKYAIANKSRMIRIPYHQLEKINKLKRLNDEFEKEYGRKPTIEELSQKSKISVKEIEYLNTIKNDTVSLNILVGEDDEEELGNLVATCEDEYPIEASSEISQLIEDAKLNPNERKVIALRYGFNNKGPMTLEAIAKEMHLTRERIRQIEKDALKKFRSLPQNKQRIVAKNRRILDNLNNSVSDVITSASDITPTNNLYLNSLYAFFPEYSIEQITEECLNLDKTDFEFLTSIYTAGISNPSPEPLTTQQLKRFEKIKFTILKSLKKAKKQQPGNQQKVLFYSPTKSN